MMRPKHISLSTFFALLLSSCVMTACFGPKNLVTKQKDIPSYDFVGDTLNGWALVRQDSLWGYVSETKTRVIRPMFLWATDFVDGMALARDEHGYRYINRQGKILRRIKAPRAYSFAEGLAPVQIKDKWGYIDRKGKIVIKPQFDWAMPFQENRAAVCIGQREGYINPAGELVIPAIFEETQVFNNGVAVVRKDFRFGMIDTLGNFVFPNHFDDIKLWEKDFYRLSVYSRATDRVSRFGLADSHGKLLLDTQYVAIDRHAQDYIRVKRDNLFGLFDRRGNETIPIEHTHLGAIAEEDFTVAKKQGQWALLDMQGNYLLPFDNQTIIGASDGRIWVLRDSSFILLDEQFREIKRFRQYNRVYPFSNNYAAVSIKDTSVYDGNLYGYIDRDGNEVVAPQYDGGTGAVNPYGISIVGKKSYEIVGEYLFNIHDKALVDDQRYSSLKRFGSVLFNSHGAFLSSRTGKPIVDFPYQSIQPLGGDRQDLAVVRWEKNIGLIDTSLTELLPVEYTHIGAVHRGRMKIKQNGRWGFADEHYRIRIPIIYDDATYFGDANLTEVTQDQKKGVIDRYGREIIPPLYTRISFDPSCTRIYAEKSEGIDIYNNQGRLLQATDFQYTGFYGRKNHVAFRQDGLMGFMDYDFNILLEPEFERIGPFYDGLAWVVLKDRGGYINERFELVIPVQFENLDNFALGLAKVKNDGREYYINTQGEEVIPTEAELDERNSELERRKRGWIDFSS